MSNEVETGSLESRVIDIIATGLRKKKNEIQKESRFVDDLGADSIDQVELVLALEEEFELNIGDEVAEKFITVQDVLSYVSDNVAK